MSGFNDALKELELKHEEEIRQIRVTADESARADVADRLSEMAEELKQAPTAPSKVTNQTPSGRTRRTRTAPSSDDPATQAKRDEATRLHEEGVPVRYLAAAAGLSESDFRELFDLSPSGEVSDEEFRVACTTLLVDHDERLDDVEAQLAVHAKAIGSRRLNRAEDALARERKAKALRDDESEDDVDLPDKGEAESKRSNLLVRGAQWAWSHRDGGPARTPRH